MNRHLDALHPARFNRDLLAAIPTLQTVREDGVGLVHYLLAPDPAGGWTLTVPDDTDPAALDAVIAQHDAVTPWPGDVQRDDDQSRLVAVQERFQDALDALATTRTALADANWSSLTVAQRQEALRQALQRRSLLDEAILRAVRVLARRMGAPE